MGVAYETAKSGVGVASMGVMRLKLVMKSIILVVMARVLGIYDLIIAAIISAGINPKAKPYFLDGYTHLSFELACSLAGLAAGTAISIVRDTRVRYCTTLIAVCMLEHI
ncbi:V-type proton ATPase 16 kDa proteolipid subunit-like [Zea mays]|jgi:V-type H+-transporting ATPase 16kDa proteolipid subunit|uniref:V-type proton ATPase 16 kDa proteolipid subunit-like n=1 Tax=Zea mays TaxID=4577 RepID=UPI000221E3EB|nr:V-type proton ATPase 16 kDa proteolipid subunit-like [Zea mays]|eukprot:XP_020407587.1 V-type proton ATPase 16 kDa proteolipid subunit-like [Zea mays]